MYFALVRKRSHCDDSRFKDCSAFDWSVVCRNVIRKNVKQRCEKTMSSSKVMLFSRSKQNSSECVVIPKDIDPENTQEIDQQRMISATTKVASGAAASTATIDMRLPPPSSISTLRDSAYVSTSQLVPSLLSELSFIHEVPHSKLNMIMERQIEASAKRKNYSTENKNDHKDESSHESSLISSWQWNGLLCFSLNDSEMFFDAEEKLVRSAKDGMDSDGKIIDAMTMVTLSESSEASNETTELVEVKPDKAAAIVAAACELRGGQQQHQPYYGYECDPRNPFSRLYAPPAPIELPVRFLRAGKGDPIEGQRRYEATLQWRKENGIDNILFEAHPLFEMVKQHYPHYFHLRGKKGEPVFFEQPPKTDLAALRAGGMDLQGLVRHYAMVTEFQWQFIERNDFARSITVFDLEGMRMMDFVGEVIDYVKLCSQFTGQHYPERAGHVIVVNVPRW